ncbi:MAG: hypothetical protein ABFR53_05400 [Actinomycetota bacterium]
MTDNSHLERALSELADSIEWPDASSHAPTRVTARIEGERDRKWRPIWRRVSIGLGVAMVFISVLVFSPLARQAVADLLSATGIRIDFTSDPPPTTGAGLTLGEEVDLVDVVQQVDFVLRQPQGDEPGPPSAVYLDVDGQVTMVWEGDQTLPAAGDTGVALLLSQSKASDGSALAYKGISPDTQVQTVTIEGVPALWIEGTPHTITLLDARGQPLALSTRLAANVLLWEANGINHRIETTGDLSTVLAIVDSLAPVP